MNKISKLQETKIEKLINDWMRGITSQYFAKPLIAKKQEVVGLIIYSQRTKEELALIEFHANFNGKNIVLINNENPNVADFFVDIQLINGESETIFSKIKKFQNE